uniref:Apple domain-containing protein n=1 Tax=Romanomermis culicivorax TaxID=13658 RepID=A0A915J2D6_ROMCU
MKWLIAKYEFQIERVLKELACKWQTTPNRQMDIFTRRKFRAANFCELRASDFDDCRRSCELNGPNCLSVHFCRSCDSGLNCRLMNQRAVRGKNRLQLIAEYGSVDYSEKNCGGGDDDERENDDDDSADDDKKKM